MKKLILLVLFAFFCMIATASLGAEDFLGAPVILQGKIIQKTDARLELKTELSHNEALTFYREALKGLDDIKFRDWKDATYIEDDGSRPWHSITISKGDSTATSIIIVKDSWTWIIGTLLLRYVGVFVVLMVLFLGMSVSGKIISRSVEKAETKKQQEKDK